LDQLLVFRLQRAVAQGALEQHFDFVEIEWLGDEVPRASPHCFHRGVHRTVGGHHHRHWRLRQGQRFIQQIHAGFPTQPQIGEKKLDWFGLQNRHRLGNAGRRIHIEFLLQRTPQALAGGAFVINDQ
jgi:hypothetical protein